MVGTSVCLSAASISGTVFQGLSGLFGAPPGLVRDGVEPLEAKQCAFGMMILQNRKKPDKTSFQSNKVETARQQCRVGNS